MSSIRVTGSCDGIELDKRQYMPGIVLEYDCPKCGATCKKDLGHDYLKQYAPVGEPIKVTGYCPACEHEDWLAGYVVIKMTVEPVEAPASS